MGNDNHLTDEWEVPDVDFLTIEMVEGDVFTRQVNCLGLSVISANGSDRLVPCLMLYETQHMAGAIMPLSPATLHHLGTALLALSVNYPDPQETKQ